jgi:hypothetical protein
MNFLNIFLIINLLNDSIEHIEDVNLQQNYFLIWECIQSSKNTFLNVAPM